MSAPATAVFNAWEDGLKFDNIPLRMTELLERKRQTEQLNSLLASVKPLMRRTCGNRVPVPAIGVLSIWDLVALVGRDATGGYCIGVGVGSLRLLDLFSACLCAIVFDQRV